MTEQSQDEIRMLRESARDFVRRLANHKRLRELRETSPGYDEEVELQMAGMGWHGILIPEEYGGLNLGFSSMATVLEELGRGLLADPLVSNVILSGRAMLHGDNESLKSRLLPPMAAGDLQVSLAWQERPGVIEPIAIDTTAVRNGATYRLDGVKRFVAGAASADGFLVSASAGNAPGDLALYWVPRNASGLDLSLEWRADGTPCGTLTLRNVVVSADDVVASPSAANRVIERAVDEAAVLVGAEMLGVMRAALDMTLDYMRSRVQFDKPIGSFQALQHRAVDLYVQQELASAVISEATDVLDGDANPIERVKMVARCKSRCNEAVLKVTRDAIQLHGGIGTTDECDIGLYLKRALTLSAWLGNGPVQRRRYSAIAEREMAIVLA